MLYNIDVTQVDKGKEKGNRTVTARKLRGKPKALYLQQQKRKFSHKIFG